MKRTVLLLTIFALLCTWGVAQDSTQIEVTKHGWFCPDNLLIDGNNYLIEGTMMEGLEGYKTIFPFITNVSST